MTSGSVCCIGARECRRTTGMSPTPHIRCVSQTLPSEERSVSLSCLRSGGGKQSNEAERQAGFGRLNRHGGQREVVPKRDFNTESCANVCCSLKSCLVLTDKTIRLALACLVRRLIALHVVGCWTLFRSPAKVKANDH